MDDGGPSWCKWCADVAWYRDLTLGGEWICACEFHKRALLEETAPRRKFLELLSENYDYERRAFDERDLGHRRLCRLKRRHH